MQVPPFLHGFGCLSQSVTHLEPSLLSGALGAQAHALDFRSQVPLLQSAAVLHS